MRLIDADAMIAYIKMQLEMKWSSHGRVELSVNPPETGKKVLTMAKYIDRDSLIEWLKRIRLIDLSDGLGICRVIMEKKKKKAIKNMPENIIVDVAPVRHGRWERTADGAALCTACKRKMNPSQYGYAFFIFFWAKMDGGDCDEVN